MAFHDAYEAIHEKLIQSDTVSEHNLSVTTNHTLLTTKLMAPVKKTAQPDLCDSGQWMYQIYGQLACNPAFYSGHRTNEGHHLL